LFFWRFDGFLSTGGDECARFITQNIFQTFLTGHGAVGKTAIGEATSKRSPAPPHDGAPILKEKELKEFIQLFSTFTDLHPATRINNTHDFDRCPTRAILDSVETKMRFYKGQTRKCKKYSPAIKNYS
jgi:hypothetical protein